jgi:hypothetical protein
MEYEITLEDDGLVEVTGHVGFQFEDKRCDPDDKFMTGIALAINGRHVRSPLGTFATQNAQCWQHYRDMPFSSLVPLERGEHVIELMAVAVPKGRSILSGCQAWFKQSHYNGMAIKVYAP